MRDISNKILLAIATIVIMTVIFELAFSIFGPKYPQFNTHSSEYFTNPRGYYDAVRIDPYGNQIYSIRYRFDKNEYRLPEKQGIYLAYDEDKDVKILGLGDSFAWGQGVRYDDLYLTRLETLLSEENKKVDYQVLNSGKKGHNVKSVMQEFLEKTKNRSFNIIIYGFVLNDFTRDNLCEDLIDYNNCGTDSNSFQYNSAIFRYFYHSIRKWRIKEYTIKSYLNSFEDTSSTYHFNLLNKMDKDSKEKNSTFILVIFPLLYHLDETYPFVSIHDKIKSYGQENDFLVLDLLPYYREYADAELWAAPTDQHPNELAHNITARAIFEFMQEHKLIE